MTRILKLMTDYGCFSLWEYADDGDLIDNVNPDDLPLKADLKAALRAWANAYDKTLNQAYPPDSGFANPAEEEAFENEGRRLWTELQAQLGPKYRVTYFSTRDSRLLE